MVTITKWLNNAIASEVANRTRAKYTVLFGQDGAHEFRVEFRVQTLSFLFRIDGESDNTAV